MGRLDCHQNLSCDLLSDWLSGHEICNPRVADQGLGHKSIAVRVGTAPSTVRETLRRLERAGLSWPLGEDVSDAVLETALYKAAGTKTGHRRIAEPVWAHVHRELKR